MPVAVLRSWLRYVVPLTLLAALTMLPLLWIAARIQPANQVALARAQLRLGWELVGMVWIAQLWLVAAVTPAVDSVLRGKPVSQVRALTAGVAGLVRGFVPCLVAAIAIAIGGLALVIPGVVLLVLFAMTGASERLREPLPAPQEDSVAAVRRHVRAAILAVALLVVVDVAIGVVAQLAIVKPLGKPITSAALVAPREFVRTIVVALVALSALPACALATVARHRS